MQHFYRHILIFALLYSTAARASDILFYVDALYWKATDSIDWAYDNNLDTPDQQITYQPAIFNYEPGFRVGIGYGHDWDTGIYYTKYSTQTTDSASGNLKSGFMGGTIGLPAGYHFYQSGQFEMSIDFNMFDWYLGKRFHITPAFMLHPIIGLEGGWIDQSLKANLQGHYNTTEVIRNNFWGIGPKFGIDGSLVFLQQAGYTSSFVAEFSTAYLLGNWDITDVFNDNAPHTIDIDLANRNLGALVFQGMLGVDLSYKHFSVRLSYEINDWLNQTQFFDDATGAHNNDLILQGPALRFAYNPLT